MLKIRRLSLALLLILASSLSALAQSAAGAKAAPPKPAQGITQRQADAILDELRQIRQLLEAKPEGGAIANELRLLRQTMEKQQTAAAAPAPPPAPAPPQNARVNIAGLVVLGRPDAPLTMVEFSDYQCAFCRAFHSDTFNELKKNWIDTGKLRFISWDLPLEFHSNAAKAAQAARCAGDQNKFWEMRSLLIANATKLESEAVLGYAQQLPQLDFQRFKACVQADRYSADIANAAAGAKTQGISGTPTFLIGKTNGDLVDGQLLVGAQPFAVFDKQLKEQLPR
jgi:protein-disulfide isomerase